MQKKYILFDNDGVLVETEKWYHRANVDVLELMGLKISEERYREIMINGQSALMIADEHGIESEIVESYRDKRNELYQHYIRTENIDIDGVGEILKRLGEKYRMGVITSSHRDDFDLIHNSRDIMSHMEFALCSGEYTRSKPHADPYLEGLALFKGQKHEAIIVEDSGRGLRSAVNAGIECVVVYNDFTSSHDLCDATYNIDTLDELESLLD